MSTPSSIRPSRTLLRRGVAGLLTAGLFTSVAADTLHAEEPVQDLASGPFRRVASFPVFLNTDVELETVAEIVTVTDDGMTLVYTDSPTGSIGFVDITDPAAPVAGGSLAVGGEPTSIDVAHGFVIVAVNTSADFVNPSGVLQVVDPATKAIVATIALGGQPDSIKVSPDGRYAAVVIENERDEDLGDGEPPQAPPGFLAIVDLVGTPDAWTVRTVDLVGVPDLFPGDPEPEFVDVNARNLAIVTLQENNHLVLVRLATGDVVADFPAGAVDLDGIDVADDGLIAQSAALSAVAREPDAVTWIDARHFATADEGDLFGGSRGFTIFDLSGNVVYGSGNALDRVAARVGHYPDGRSDNKGCEPESIEFASYGDRDFLFVGSERANVVFVHDVTRDKTAPRLVQVLPTGSGPEGLLAIPERGLFVTANEVDAREDKIRATLSIFALGEPNYPTIVSDDRASGEPIPWAALSGLAIEPSEPFRTLHTVYDSFYRESRVFELDLTTSPARITDEIPLRDADGVLLQSLAALQLLLPDAEDYDVTALVNADGSVNLDPEGIAVGLDGDFWIVSEGTGNLVAGVSDPDNRPFESPNLLLEVARDGLIKRAVQLPFEVVQNQLRFGFEGVAATLENGVEVLYVAFQREWTKAGDPTGFVRIGRYDTATATWGFALYPIETPVSPNGGWVGLSDIAPLGGSEFAVLERDDQGGPDAAIKLVTRIDVSSVTFRPADAASFDVLTKVVVRDLLAEGDYTSGGGLVPEKLEGLAVLPNGDALIVNDNDGVDDNNGETRLLRLAGLFD